MSNIYTEIRNWILFILAIPSVFITIKTYVNSTNQRKIDNTFKILDFLRKHIQLEQIQTFVNLFEANSESHGIKFNEFKLSNGKIETVETMFSEAGCGNGHIHNLIELFNLLCPTLDKLETTLIWYEYGQIMTKLFDWTNYLEKANISNTDTSFFKDFNIYMNKNFQKMLKKPMKFYTYSF